MDDHTSFGYWVQRPRKALDLTQEELAQRVGCALDTIRKIESGARRPSRQVAERLADQLDLPADMRAAFLQAARAELAADRLAPRLAFGRLSPSRLRISASCWRRVLSLVRTHMIWLGRRGRP